MTTLKQLTLDVLLDDHNTFDNFYVGDNHELMTCLRAFSDNSEATLSDRFIYVWGPHSSGRSHLLHACCHEANKINRTCFYLTLQNINKLTPQILENIETVDLVCLDDIQNISNKAEWEEAIFKLFNAIKDNQKQLIVTANVAPTLLPITLPDLKSRLAWGLPIQINPLNDEQKLMALQMRANNRGLQLSDVVGKYLLNRYTRDTKNLFLALDRLDKASLTSKRKLTIPFVKLILEKVYC
jgi:DnaA-homolog protein